MIIKNYRELATSPLREAALDIIEMGLGALQSETIIREQVSVSGHTLRIMGREFDLSRYTRLFVIGVGKAAVGMGTAIENILGERITGGYILDRKRGHFDRLTGLVGTHPDPSEQNVVATREMLEFLSGADGKSLVLVLISGGGSALLTAPHGITVAEKAAIARTLMNNGATIHELNTVRKHLSDVKGGQLAKFAYPATVISLILSDVPGNDVSTIASGPTVLDNSTVSQAERIVKKYHASPPPSWQETPKDPKYFERVTNIVLGTAASAFGPMDRQARAHGFTPRVLSDHVTGEANRVGRGMLKRVRRGEALLAAGETTVKVRGTGHGGRNQQLVLASLPSLRDGQLILSVGTDGHDNTDHAGALGDEGTVSKSKEKKLDPKTYAARNDSYTFFTLTDDAIVTGELESNFADLIVCLSKKS